MRATLAPRRRLRPAQLSAALGSAACELAAEAALPACVDRSLGAVGDRAEGEPVGAELARAASLAPLMEDGGAIAGLDFDASVAWPAYDWMGVA